MLHVGQYRRKLCGISRVEHITPGASSQQSRGIEHRFVLGGSAHAGPNEEPKWDSVSVSDASANLLKFSSNRPGPLGMFGGLPAQIEHAVAVLCHVPLIVDFHADTNKGVLAWVERIETLFAGSCIQYYELFENVLP